MIKNFMEENTLNRSVEAPIDGVYRYELIPAENPINYYIDLWYQYGMGLNDEELIKQFDDAFYLKKGEYVIVDINGNVVVKKKEKHLKLVVNNE